MSKLITPINIPIKLKDASKKVFGNSCIWLVAMKPIYGTDYQNFC